MHKLEIPQLTGTELVISIGFYNTEPGTLPIFARFTRRMVYYYFKWSRAVPERSLDFRAMCSLFLLFTGDDKSLPLKSEDMVKSTKMT